jgi:hypothetical protein
MSPSMTAPVFMICGSRFLPASESYLVANVVWSLLGNGSRLVIGCSIGADAFALSAAAHSVLAPQVSVLAAFGPVSPPWKASYYWAPGAWSGSAVAQVAAAMFSGASVRWWSGGPESVPLRERLSARSRACVSVAVDGGLESCVVAFVDKLPPHPSALSTPLPLGGWPLCGSNSWASVATANLMGIPAIVFPVGSLIGISISSLPAMSGSGSWSKVMHGTLGGGFCWSPRL